jgi:hypothetical protein
VAGVRGKEITERFKKATFKRASSMPGYLKRFTPLLFTTYLITPSKYLRYK